VPATPPVSSLLELSQGYLYQAIKAVRFAQPYVTLSGYGHPRTLQESIQQHNALTPGLDNVSPVPDMNPGMKSQHTQKQDLAFFPKLFTVIFDLLVDSV
jgi:hypothetical protein